MEILGPILYMIFVLIGLKAVIIGSNFSFPLWIKYGKEYVDWYNDWQKQKFEHWKK